jgi:small conductance mechanosensitive channel
LAIEYKEVVMKTKVSEYQELGLLMIEHGQELLLALAILIVGLIALKFVFRLLRRFINKLDINPRLGSTINMIVCTFIFFLVIAAVLQQMGMADVVIQRLVFGLSLAAVGVVTILRPLIPPLPFTIGNTVKFGDLFGKIEAITLINTRMKTFDGKTVFIPNQKIINDYVINYHFTETRRVKIDVTIRFDQDVLRAKQLLEALMIADPRVEVNPRPQVYFLNMENNCVKLGGRCWVVNMDYWVTRCELIEKTKLCFDHEGIKIAFPPREVHNFNASASQGFQGEPNALPDESLEDVK